MTPLGLTPLRTLVLEPGEGAPFVACASGLVWTRDYFYVVADDALFLAQFPASGAAPGRRARLFSGALPEAHAARKTKKPDLESLCLLPPSSGEGAVLLAIPSGSTALRTRGAWARLDAAGALAGSPPSAVDFAPLFSRLAAEVPALNLEGAAVQGARLWVANRGNRAAPSCLFELDLTVVAAALVRGAPVEASAFRRAVPLELGAAAGVPLTPTDLCALDDGTLLACAAAEDTASAYDDGQTAGAALALLGERGQVLASVPLPAGLKPEGLWGWRAGPTLAVRLVCDADDPAVASPLLAGAWTP